MKFKFKKSVYWLADPLIWMAVFVLLVCEMWTERRNEYEN